MKYGLKAARQLLAENMPKGIFPSRSYSLVRDKERQQLFLYEICIFQEDSEICCR